MQHIVIETIGAFSIFVFLQALFINGVHESCKGTCTEDFQKGKIYSGNIIYMLNPEWFERNKYKIWAKPIYTCVRCMSSVIGALIFWPVVIFIYGFHWFEIIVYVYNVFILVTLNWWVYKKL